MKKPLNSLQTNLLKGLISVSLLLPCLSYGLQFELGETDILLDSTISIGGTYRLGDQDPDLIGTSNGGNLYSLNSDDGNLNFDKGWVSQAVKMTNDLEINGDNIGAFFRVTSFYDFEVTGTEMPFRDLSQKGYRQVGSDVDLLDAFLYWNVDAGEMPLDFRIGSQVLSWGESTFIQNGINAINPIDVAKIRIPGAELKEALIPVPMLSVSLGLTENITLEAFYQWKWEKTLLEPNGSYFSANDLVSEGADKVWLGFGAVPQGTPFGYVPRGQDNEGSDSGQYGIAARIYAPALNDTEFGFYYMQYNSRTPLVSSITPTGPINPDLTGPLTTVFAGAGLAPEAAQAQATGLMSLLTAYATYGPGALSAEQLAMVTAPQTQAAIDGAKRIALLTAITTANYIVEYPDGIDLFGMSFNTALGRTGWSLQGELSYRPNQPVQLDDVEMLFANMSVLEPSFGYINQFGNYFGHYEEYLSGYREKDMYQFQMTATKVFGGIFGADSMVFVAEAGYTSLPGLSDTNIRFDGPSTVTSGNPLATIAGIQPATQSLDHFATENSWGYRVVSRLEYNNLFAGINVLPSIQFAHDVDGITPLPIGNFLEGRKTMTLGVEFNYLNQWSSRIRYTNYWDVDNRNAVSDRDFVSADIKYSF